MNAPPKWALALALAALAWYMAPASWIARWRISLYDRLPGGGRGGGGAASGDAVGDAVGALANQLRLREAEVGRWRRRAAELAAGPPAAVDKKGERWPEWRYWSARVVRRADTGDPDTAVLDRGADDGVRAGDAVVANWALAGVVDSAGRRFCRVRLVGHPRWRIAARLSAPAAEPAAAGDAGDAGEDGDDPAEAGSTPAWQCAVVGQGRAAARAEVYARRADAGAGWTVATSGLAGRLPPGLLVGTLAEAPGEADDRGVRAAAVRLAVSPESLDDVLIVRETHRD